MIEAAAPGAGHGITLAGQGASIKPALGAILITRA